MSKAHSKITCSVECNTHSFGNRQNPEMRKGITHIITYLRIVDYMAVIFLGQPSVEDAVVVAAK